MTLRPVLSALGLLGLLASSASAQGSAGPSFSLVLRGVTFSACVQFLVDPVEASKDLEDGYQIVPARSFPGLSPVLQREIEGDSVHGGWVPAQVCIYEAPSVSAGGGVLQAEGKMGNRQLVGYWGLGARRVGGNAAEGQWYAAALYTNDWHLERQAKTVYIPMTIVKRSMSPVPESTRHRYEVKLGKTTLTWDGEIGGRDSAQASTSIDASLVFTGLRDIQWHAVASSRPDWTRNLPGLFRVEGKDDLAKALKASPIRMFGPMFWGGDARLDFAR